MGTLRGTGRGVPAHLRGFPRGGAPQPPAQDLRSGVPLRVRRNGGRHLQLRRRRRRAGPGRHAALRSPSGARGKDRLVFYYVGLDLGQSQDYTALAVLETQLWTGSLVDWADFGVFFPDGIEPGGG